MVGIGAEVRIRIGARLKVGAKSRVNVWIITVSVRLRWDRC